MTQDQLHEVEVLTPDWETLQTLKAEGKISEIANFALPILKLVSKAWFLSRKIRSVIKVLIAAIEEGQQFISIAPEKGQEQA